MKKFISGLIFSLPLFLFAQDILVYIDDQPYISKAEFTKLYDYTLKNDKTRSKEQIVSDYVSVLIKSKLANQAKLTESPDFYNPMGIFFNEQQTVYKNQDSLSKDYFQEIKERLANELKITQYELTNLTTKQLNILQKNPASVVQMKPKINMMPSYIQAGDLPYELETELYHNLKKDYFSKPKTHNNNTIITKIEAIRPYTGKSSFQYLLLHANENEKLNEIRTKALSGTDFSELVKQYSIDPQAQKNLGYTQIANNILDESVLKIIQNTAVNDITPIFKIKENIAIVKIIEKNTQIDSKIITEKIEQSTFYTEEFTKRKMNYMTEHYELKEDLNKISRLANDFNLQNVYKNAKKEATQDELYDAVLTYFNQINRNDLLFTLNNGYEYKEMALMGYYATDIKKMVDDNQYNSQLLPFYQYVKATTLAKIYDNSIVERIPEMKQKTDQYGIVLLADSYEKYLLKEVENDTVALKKKYEQLKENYKWKERVAVIMAYCGTNKAAAEGLVAVMKKNTVLESLSKDYEAQNIFFKKMLKETTSTDLPKNYKAQKGVKLYEENGQYYVLNTLQVLPPTNPSFEELKPILIEQVGQDQLEQNIMQYKKEHHVLIDKNILQTL